MSKITYVLTLFGHGMHPSPVPVCGWLQPAPYGYAEYNQVANTHILRVSQEQWEGGMASDLAQKIRTHMDQWIVTAEVEPDLESPEGKHAQEVDELRSRIAELEAAREVVVRLTPGPVAEVQAAAAPEAPPVDPATPPATPPVDLPAHPKKLEALCRELGIDVTADTRTVVKMRAAIEAHYAKTNP